MASFSVAEPVVTGSHKINNCMGQILLARADGQDADHRRDRRRPARRRHRHGLRPLRPALRRLHGRGGRGAAGAQRAAHEPAGRGGAAGDQRLGDPEGRHERGAARLGHQRRRHLLPDRLGGRPAPLSGDGARLPAGDRRGGARAGAGGRGPAARRAGGLRRRRLQRHRPLPPVPERRGVRLYRRRGGRRRPGRPAATPRRINGGRPGVLHGNTTYLLQDGDGQITEAHSISAGLDYPGIGPEHAWLHDVGRARPTSRPPTTRRWTRSSCCARLEGILPALESAHALARLAEVAPEVGKDGIIVLNLSGRGDKDLATVAAATWGRPSVTRRPHRRPLRRAEARKAAPASSPMSWPAIPTRRRRCAILQRPAGRRRRHHRAGLSVLRSRWPTARRSSAPRCGRWPPA